MGGGGVRQLKNAQKPKQMELFRDQMVGLVGSVALALQEQLSSYGSLRSSLLFFFGAAPSSRTAAPGSLQRGHQPRSQRQGSRAQINSSPSARTPERLLSN